MVWHRFQMAGAKKADMDGVGSRCGEQTAAAGRNCKRVSGNSPVILFGGEGGRPCRGALAVWLFPVFHALIPADFSKQNSKGFSMLRAAHSRKLSP